MTDFLSALLDMGDNLVYRLFPVLAFLAVFGLVGVVCGWIGDTRLEYGTLQKWRRFLYRFGFCRLNSRRHPNFHVSQIGPLDRSAIRRLVLFGSDVERKYVVRFVDGSKRSMR